MKRMLRGMVETGVRGNEFYAAKLNLYSGRNGIQGRFLIRNSTWSDLCFRKITTKEEIKEVRY